MENNGVLDEIVLENDKYNDGNENCRWMNVALKNTFDKEKDARDFLQKNFDKITNQFTLYPID